MGNSLQWIFVFSLLLAYLCRLATLRNSWCCYIGTHPDGIGGGAIWCIGMSFNIIASGKAGPAISYGLGQGATIVAALWGIYIWKEFKNAPKGTSSLLNIMLLCYVIGLGLLIAAK